MRRTKTPFLPIERGLDPRIKNLCLRFARESFLEADEVMQEAIYVISRAESRFDPTNGASKATYLYRVVENHLIRWAPKQFRDSNPMQDDVPSFGGIFDDSPSHHDPERLAIYYESLRKLSKEAKIILSVLFESPGEIINSVGGLKPKLIRGEIYRRCRGLLPLNDVWVAMKEIRRFAQTL